MPEQQPVSPDEVADLLAKWRALFAYHGTLAERERIAGAYRTAAEAIAPRIAADCQRLTAERDDWMQRHAQVCDEAEQQLAAERARLAEIEAIDRRLSEDQVRLMEELAAERAEVQRLTEAANDARRILADAIRRLS